ncbi:MAG TPA: hypothetical protein PLL66_08875 [Bacteroidales bacterium]|nr:hypothetical protein [Bacteroidales bacterium]
MKKNLLLLVAFISSVLIGYSQKNEEVIISSVSGIGYDDCVSVAREKALTDAKKTALQKAGISEDINAYSDLFKSETTGNYQELFASSVFTNIRGNVSNVEVLQEKLSITGEKIAKCELEISCKVIKFNSMPDNMYKAEINGLKAFYIVGENLNWSVMVTKDSWMYTFCIPQDQDEAYFLFPNELEKEFNLEKEKIYDFPKNVTYTQTLESEYEQTDRLIFVFTKEKYPYTGEITYKNICDWIFSIEPDQRVVYSYAVAIFPKPQ